MSDWSKHQENIFKRDSVIEAVLQDPIMRERIDVAVNMIGTGNTVLDVGAGDGGISDLINKKGNDVTAFDLQEVLDTIPEDRRKWLKSQAGDASKPWPFESETYDVVFAGEIIEHFIEIDVFLNEAWRVLKKNGLLVLTTPNVARELNRIALLFGNVHTWHEWDKPVHHIRYFTPDTIQFAVQKYGFRPETLGTARSRAESPLEGNPDFTPQERQVLSNIMARFTPHPVWKHSFIILGSRKVERSHR